MNNPIIDVAEAHISNYSTHEDLAHYLEKRKGYSIDQMEFTYVPDFDGEPDFEMIRILVHEHTFAQMTM